MSSRLIGYGAYNLCFDSLMGKKLNPAANDPDFFQFIRNGHWPINLVKVIIFRKSTLEGLPANRAIPLFKPNKQINEAFLTHLDAFVGRAAELNFTVQLCVFSFHSVALGTDPDSWEFPENVPADLDPRLIGNNNCNRLRNFFSVDRAPATLAAQRTLATRIAMAVRFRTNIIWEMANELRIQGCSAADNKAGNCNIIPWYNQIWDDIDGHLIPQHSPHTISTGIDNERVLFTNQRPYDGCSHKSYRMLHYDFHAGQWDAMGNYKLAIDAAKQRIATYDSPLGGLALNDDGVKDSERTNARVWAWARAAFERGCGYLSKQQYEPGERFDVGALNSLNAANNEVPLS